MKKIALVRCCCIVLMLLHARVLNAQLSWDRDSTFSNGIQINGTGTWDTTLTNWSNGTSNVAWNNTTHATTTAVFGISPPTGTTGGTITVSGTINLGGMKFLPFSGTPTGTAYTFTGGTLAFANDAIIEMGDTSTTGSGTALFMNLNSVVTGNNMTIQRAAGSTITGYQYVRFGGANPALTGTLTLKSNSASNGIFVLVAGASSNAGLSRVVVENGSTYAIGGSNNNYAVPLTLAGTGQNNGAVRFDTTGIILSGAITLNGTSLLHNNSGVTGIVVSGPIGENGGAQGIQHSAIIATNTLTFTGTSNFTGATTLGRTGATGGLTILDFSAAGAPVSDIFYNGVTAGTLSFVGNSSSPTPLNLIGKAGAANSQRFGGVTVGTGTLGVLNLTSGTGGSMNVSLGAITRATASATGLLAITAPASGTVTATGSGFIGAWATYRDALGTTGWAQIVGGTLTGGFVGDLAHTTGTAISALGGYAANKNLTISSTSTGSVTMTGATTDINTVSMTDTVLDRSVALSGILRLGAAGGIQLSAGARDLTLTGGTLTVGGAVTNGPGQLILTNNSTTSVLQISSTIANNGTTAGALTLVVNGVSGSKTVLNGTNTFTGGGLIASGAVELRSNGALGSTGTVSVMEGAALQVGGGITLSRALSVGGTGVANDGVIRNLGGDNTLSGQITTTSPIRIQSDSGTLTFFNTNATTVSILAGSASFPLSFGGAGDIVINSRLSTTTQTITKDGTGRLTLGGDNSVITTGVIAVTAGALRVTNVNALGATTGATTVTSGASLELAFASDSTLAEPVTFDGAGLNGTGAIRNISGNNTLSGILTVGTTAVTTIMADSGTTLTLSGTVRSGATLAGTRTVSLGGAGTINVTGAITAGVSSGNPEPTYMTALTKIDSGTVNLRSANTFAPATTSATTLATILTTVRGGVLNFDFANASATSHLIASSNNISIGGGTLKITGKDATTNTQSVISTTLSAGRSNLVVNSGTGGTVNLALGTILRANNSGSALNITLPGTGSITTTTLNTNGIINGGMVVGGTTWATSAATQTSSVVWNDTGDTIAVGSLVNGSQVSFAGTAPAGLTAGVTYYVVNSTASTFQVALSEGGTAIVLTNSGTAGQLNRAGVISGLSTYSPTFAANANVDVAEGATTQAATLTVNSLRFNAAAGSTVNLGATLTSASGGILITPNVTGDVTIQSDSTTARTLANTSSDFTVHHYGSGAFNIGSTVTVTAAAITKTGTGTMNFAGLANSAGAQVRATEGTLNIVGSNRFTSATDPAFFIGSVDVAAKVSFGNGASTGAESFTAINVLGTGSSLVGSGSALYTISMQNAGVNDWRNLMIGGTGTNENNLSVEAFSAGTIQLGASNTFAGRVNIGRSTFEVSVLANAGTASSLGTGATTPTIDMHDTNSTNTTTSTLRYVGTTDAVTDRAIRLYTDGVTMPSLTGVVENNGTGTVKFTSAFTAAGNTTLARTLRLSGSNTGVNEIVSMGDGPSSVVSLDKAGTGRWALTGTSSYTGGTTVSNGILQLGTGGTSGMVGSGDIAISAGATLATNRSDTFSINNNITGAGAVVISNTSTGVTTLSSMNNTYSGGTTVKTGTLVFTNADGGSATGIGSVVVESTGTLAGMGFVTPESGGYIDVAGVIRVGLSSSTAATMTIMTVGAGGLGIESTGVLLFDLVSGAGSGMLNGAGSSDLLVLGGNVNLVAGSTLRVENLNGLSNWAAGDAWKLIDWTTLGTIRTDTFTTVDLPALGGAFQWDTSALYSTGIITIMVPEPSRLLLVMAGALLLIARRRRR